MGRAIAQHDNFEAASVRQSAKQREGIAARGGREDPWVCRKAHQPSKLRPFLRHAGFRISMATILGATIKLSVLKGKVASSVAGKVEKGSWATVSFHVSRSVDRPRS